MNSGFIAKYAAIFKLTWVELMVYRINFVMEILSGVVSSLIVAFLWLAIYRSASQEIIGGYSVQEMLTYILGGGLINSFILTTAENPEISNSIRNGTLSSLLLQPASPFSIWFVRDLGRKAFLFTLGIVSYLTVMLLFGSYIVLPTSSPALLLFLCSLLLGALLQYFLFAPFGLLAFWLEDTYGIRFLLRVVMEVMGGAIIPISFFPGMLEKLFLLFPFPFLVYFPMRIYLGKISPLETALAFLEEILWISGLGIVNYLLWRKGIRNYAAMGD